MGLSSVTASSAADRAVVVLPGSEVAAMADDDQCRHVDGAATMRVGTGSTNNVRSDSGSLQVANLDKEDAPAVTCVESWILRWVGVRGCWLHNMLSMNLTEMKM